MTFPRVLLFFSICLFGFIGIVSMFRGDKSGYSVQVMEVASGPIEIELDLGDVEEVVAVAESGDKPGVIEEVVVVQSSPYAEDVIAQRRAEGVPHVDHIEDFFNKGKQKFPIVETVRYSSRAPWQKGRPAWIADYASHYKTSRHFIARSLNGKADYYKQDVSEGDRFNVLNPEKNINFYLVIDTQCCKMLFYYHDEETDERVLVKTYDIGLGRIDDGKESGLLTPLGIYSLGDKIATYKPDKIGYYNGDKVEMIRVFGTRWVPFGDEISGCTEPSKGLGIHGLPWLADAKGKVREDVESLGQYASDGCIRLSTADMEELFAIIITRPTIIELVKNLRDAHLPGTEK